MSLREEYIKIYDQINNTIDIIFQWNHDKNMSHPTYKLFGPNRLPSSNLAHWNTKYWINELKYIIDTWDEHAHSLTHARIYHQSTCNKVKEFARVVEWNDQLPGCP